ncbi:MAG: peptidase [Mycobacterium sp.]
MRRSTTSVGTERSLLGLLLLAELILAATLVGTPAVGGPRIAAALTTPTVSLPASSTLSLPYGRTAQFIGLGEHTAPLLTRIGGQIGDAAQAVTEFWGTDWPRDIVVVAAGSDEQFAALAGGGADIAAATTAERIVFAPGAAAMSDAALRIVLRHELFHYATRAATASDAPRWLTEGVADFIARPHTARPQQAASLAALPTDADLERADAARSPAYDRAWWFSRFVVDRYGTAALRALYLNACGAGHPGVETAVRETLGADMDEVLTRWRQWLTG